MVAAQHGTNGRAPDFSNVAGGRKDRRTMTRGKKLIKGESSKSKTINKWKKEDKKRKRKGAEIGESSKRRKSKRNEWLGLRTRSSPLQLFKCISILKENQREAVRKMGFGQLLSFRVDGIPAKLGHYVVDRFNGEKMEIKMPCGKIKVDKEAIHQLLGLPCEGIKLDSVTPLDPLDDTVTKWRKRYPGPFVPPSQIVTKIESSDDEDNFNFRLDFLMLFLAVMVECHTNGRCRENVLKYLRGDTEFNEIDWCSYIIKSMKTCKKGWRRCDRNSPFVGPLTILTLLYVDNIECKGVNVDGNMDAITFWNMERLKTRETLEIKGVGFGRGNVKGMSSAMIVPSQDFQQFGRIEFMVEMSKVKKQFDVMVKEKKKIEDALSQIYQKYPEKEEVLTLIAMYEALLEDKPTWPSNATGESMETEAKLKVALARISEQVNNDFERTDNECMDEGERNTNEEMIVVAKFVTDLMQPEKSSAGENEAGAEDDEKLMETEEKESVDDKEGLENFVDNNIEEMIEGKDKPMQVKDEPNMDAVEVLMVSDGDGSGV